jgi:protein gp37
VKGHPFEQGFDLRLVPEKLAEPLRWSEPRMIFVNSMSDLFHERVPLSYILRVAATMHLARWHTYQVLTKRSERLRDVLCGPHSQPFDSYQSSRFWRTSGNCLYRASRG